ncbi:MAG: UDP-N-acetylglucosamine--N-acetylmuramyl-(pentapeptide) pyrophosphoryl-undecaprenol N-acetylglucosamine transferase, partial [Methylobacteriaceae bacterium]|nr:UDP-N-acetylglucosamine--N-acetylmuramyl-(pentapeptide) pyrophosphoryl-undecaprenol N-acetylglucosamine transferase [Methylobacteriaceae bacterium]
LDYGTAFPAEAVHTLQPATPFSGSLAAKAAALAKPGLGTLAARSLIRRLAPMCVVGFGGYPSVPPVLAAALAHVPTLIHEQNAVMGRANRFLAPRVTAIATGFPKIGGIADRLRTKATHTGNPVRPAVIEAAGIPYPGFDDGRLRVLVTGGSQGARIMSDIVPAAVATMAPLVRQRLAVVQQARPEDVERVTSGYKGLGVAAEVAPFFKDLPARVAAAHLVVARAGASTVAELAVIGRPAILVPLPGSLDQDQAANAAWLGDRQAALVLAQRDFTPQALAAELVGGLADASRLRQAAAAARSVGIADAAERLADRVLAVAGLPDHAERSHEAAA